MKKEIAESLNIFAQCRKYKLPLWKCPQFLFIIMGFVIMCAIISSYVIGMRYLIDPLLVLTLIFVEAAILLIIAFTIIRSFESLAETNRIKSDFVDLVSHQLKTPLTAIKWGIEELKQGGFPSEYRKGINDLEDNARKISQMAGKFLVVSKIEEEEFALKKESLSLQEVVDDLKSGVFSNVSSRIKVYIDDNVSSVVGDSNYVPIVIENLISNGIKYSDEKNLEVRVKNEKKYVSLEVKDYGMGIPADEKNNVFDKFYRARNAIERDKKGSGLGLYLSKEIIKRLGGKIGMESKQDEGSLFWIKLPKV